MIEGTLVNLRAPLMLDLERNHRWINDREVTRFLSIRYEMALAAEEAWMKNVATRPMDFLHTFFAIETRDGVHIGNTNFFNLSAENRAGEVGIMIGDKAYWSKGYGGDALTTLMRFGFDEMNLHRIELCVYEQNARAIACYRRCGFVDEARQRDEIYQDGEYQDLLRMSVLRDEFYAKHGETAS
ncbi:MAG TPA: GNAT family protein [Dehalococcoidia bacterium]